MLTQELPPGPLGGFGPNLMGTVNTEAASSLGCPDDYQDAAVLAYGQAFYALFN